MKSSLAWALCPSRPKRNSMAKGFRYTLVPMARKVKMTEGADGFSLTTVKSGSDFSAGTSRSSSWSVQATIADVYQTSRRHDGKIPRRVPPRLDVTHPSSLLTARLPVFRLARFSLPGRPSPRRINHFFHDGRRDCGRRQGYRSVSDIPGSVESREEGRASGRYQGCGGRIRLRPHARQRSGEMTSTRRLLRLRTAGRVSC